MVYGKFTMLETKSNGRGILLSVSVLGLRLEKVLCADRVPLATTSANSVLSCTYAGPRHLHVL